MVTGRTLCCVIAKGAPTGARRSYAGSTLKVSVFGLASACADVDGSMVGVMAAGEATSIGEAGKAIKGAEFAGSR